MLRAQSKQRNVIVQSLHVSQACLPDCNWLLRVVK